MFNISALQQCGFQGLVAKGCPALVQLAVHGLQQLAGRQPGVGCHRKYTNAATCGPHSKTVRNKHSIVFKQPLVPSSHATASISSSSALLHSAALADHISDDENKQELPVFNPQLFPPHYSHIGHYQHHHAGHSNNHRSQSASKNQHHSHPHHHHQPHRQAGELHAAHSRRHAASSSGGGQPDALSDLLLSCKGLGVLRRVMLKYKANMGPQQIANTLLCLQHLVREARRLSNTGARRGIRMPVEHAAEEDATRQVQQRHGGVRAAQEFSRATARAAESDGPREQLVAQMMGELGNMIWHHMGDMSVHDLAKLLYSWACMEWHPEQKLLADVTASFLAAANAATGSQALQQFYCPGYVFAAGLWGLAKLGEPITGATLALLKQQWQSLLVHWNQQQLADLAWGLAAAADEIMAAEMLEQQQPCDLKDLAPLVLGLADRLAQMQRLQQQATAAADGAAGVAPGSNSSPAKCAWPEILLKETPAASAATATGKSVVAPAEDPGQVAAVAAWRMLQSLAAVGVNVSEPCDSHIGEIVAQLSHAMHLPKAANKW